MDKQNTVYICGVSYDEAMTDDTIWMNVESIMLNERSQTQTATSCMIHGQNR